MTDFYEAETKIYYRENHILTKKLTQQISNITMTKDMLNTVHYISAKQMNLEFVLHNILCTLNSKIIKRLSATIYMCIGTTVLCLKYTYRSSHLVT